MKKITMMAACFALLLSSCVTNEESQSVTNIRDAKAEHLKSLATLNNAEAAAAKTLADAEAALKAAQAKAEEAKAKEAEAQAKLLEAQAENSKIIAAAEAELLKAQAALEAAKAAKQEQEAALLAEQVKAAQAELEALKAEYAARVAQAEQAKAEAELAKAKAVAELELVTINAKAALAAAKQALATAEQDLKDELERIDGENLVDVKALFNAYKGLAEDLIDAQETLIEYKAELVKAENDLVSAQESAAALVESYENDILTYKKEIAYAEVKLEKLNSYITVDVEALNARLEELESAELSNAHNDAVMAYREYTKVEAAQSEAIEAVVNGTWASEFSYNPWGGEVFHTGYMDANGNDMTQAYYETASNLEEYVYSGWYSWDEYEQALADWMAQNGVFEVYGVYQEGEAHPVTGKVSEVFVPMFGARVAWAEEPVAIDYTLENVEGEFAYTYNPLVGVGFIDAAAMKARIAEVKATYEIGNEAYLAEMAARVEEAKEDVALWANVVKEARAWKAAYNDWYVANNDATYLYYNRENFASYSYLQDVDGESVLDENGERVLSAYASKVLAAKAEKSAQSAYDTALAKVDDLKELLASLEAKETRWGLEDTVYELVKPAEKAAAALAEAEKALAEAEKALVEKEAAVAKVEAAVEAAEIAERDAQKAYKAVLANVNSSKVQIANALAAYEKAQAQTEAARNELEKAVYLAAEAEAVVANAEAVVADATVVAEAAAAELKAAQDALADLDVAIAEVKKQIAWAEEDAVAPAAALEEAKAATVAAEAAVKAAEEKAAAALVVLATGDLQRAYAVAAGQYAYSTDDDANSVGAAESAIAQYENAVRNVAYYEGMMETDDSFDQMVEQWLALVDEAEAAYNEAVAGMAVVNEALHATGEAYIAFAELQDVHDVLEAEQSAIYTVLNESADVQQAIAFTEGLIERYTTSIENCEAEIATLTDPNANVDLEFAIAEWSKKVELQQTYVELLEAETAAAKAEYEAAVEAATKAE